MSSSTVAQNALREYAETSKLITEQEAHLRGIEAAMIHNSAQTTPNPPSDTEQQATKQKIGAQVARALGLDKKKPEDWAVFVDQILTSQSQKIVKDGKPLETTEKQVAELTSQATEFANKQLPILKALQVI
jgi:hypothetical protein